MTATGARHFYTSRSRWSQCPVCGSWKPNVDNPVCVKRDYAHKEGRKNWAAGQNPDGLVAYDAALDAHKRGEHEVSE